MASALDEIVNDLRDSDKQERHEILLDFVNRLPPLPPRLVALKDRTHRVEECVSDVYLFVEIDAGRVRLFADAPAEAPTARSFVAMLVQGLDGASVEDVLAVPNDLLDRSRLAENIGMQRMGGLQGILRRVKTEVARAAAPRP